MTPREIVQDVATRLALQAEGLTIEAERWQRLADMLLPDDTDASFISMLSGLITDEPGRWLPVREAMENTSRERAK